MSKLFGRERILAIDVTGRGLAFAALRGNKHLLDWGTVTMAKRQPAEYVERVMHLLSSYQPSFIVLEAAGRGFRCGDEVKARLEAIAQVVESLSIPVRRVTRSQVKCAFRETGMTKQAIAVEIARRFPQLQRRLPPPRKPWKSEAERMNIFDAVSFALTGLNQ